jgi:hypothetical protein
MTPQDQVPRGGTAAPNPPAFGHAEFPPPVDIMAIIERRRTELTTLHAEQEKLNAIITRRQDELRKLEEAWLVVASELETPAPPFAHAPELRRRGRQAVAGRETSGSGTATPSAPEPAAETAPAFPAPPEAPPPPTLEGRIAEALELIQRPAKLYEVFTRLQDLGPVPGSSDFRAVRTEVARSQAQGGPVVQMGGELIGLRSWRGRPRVHTEVAFGAEGRKVTITAMSEQILAQYGDLMPAPELLRRVQESGRAITLESMNATLYAAIRKGANGQLVRYKGRPVRYGLAAWHERDPEKFPEPQRFEAPVPPAVPDDTPPEALSDSPEAQDIWRVLYQATEPVHWHAVADQLPQHPRQGVRRTLYRDTLAHYFQRLGGGVFWLGGRDLPSDTGSDRKALLAKAGGQPRPGTRRPKAPETPAPEPSTMAGTDVPVDTQDYAALFTAPATPAKETES